MYFLQFFNVFSWNERWLTDYVDVLEVMDRLKQKRSFNWSFSLIKLESGILTVEPIIYWFPADIIKIQVKELSTLLTFHFGEMSEELN